MSSNTSSRIIEDEDFILAAKHQQQDWNSGSSRPKKKKNKNKKQQQQQAEAMMNNNSSSSSDDNNSEDAKKFALETHLKNLETAYLAHQQQQKSSSNSNYQNNNNNNSTNTNRFGNLPSTESIKRLSPNSSLHHHQSGFPPSSSDNKTSDSIQTNNPAAPHAPKHRRIIPQKFDIALVLDFEATCDENTADYPHEIIEFPVVALDAHCRCTSYSMLPSANNKAVVGEYHSFVKPKRNPTLTAFCTELTGITQEQVDAAPSLPEVIAGFNKWLDELIIKYRKERMPNSNSNNSSSNSNNTSNKKNTNTNTTNNDDDDDLLAAAPPVRVVFACDGPWDIRKFLFELSVCRDGVYFPPVFYSWLNVRQEFANYFKCKPLNLGQTMGRLGFHFEGKQHSGIDDSRNIARIVKVLLDRGHRFGNPCRIGTTSIESNKISDSLKRVRKQVDGSVWKYDDENDLLLFDNTRNCSNKKKNKTTTTASAAQKNSNSSSDNTTNNTSTTSTSKAVAAISTQQQQQQHVFGLDRVLIQMLQKEGRNIIKEVFGV